MRTPLHSRSGMQQCQTPGGMSSDKSLASTSTQVMLLAVLMHETAGEGWRM